MAAFFTELHPLVRTLLLGLVGVCVGNVLCRCMIRLTEPPDRASLPRDSVPDVPAKWWHRIPLVGTFSTRRLRRYRGEPTGLWWPLVELGTGVLFAAFAFAYLDLHCQEILPEVQPPRVWWIGRLFYHLVLISLLIAATGTDFRDYTISDWITVPGMLFGVAAATASGYLQMVHIWVDWNDSLTELYGPYLPEWIKAHEHLHGLAWSLCGLVAGGGLTWLVRALSKLILGHEAMGFGDVTLMAMIGSFIGWQPVLFVFLLAPLCGLAMSVLVRLATGRGFLPYGPYLSAATIVVLFAWRWIWLLRVPISSDRTFSVKHLMGDWELLAWLAGIAVFGLAALLGLVRAYRALPIGSNKD